jgi:hypothetical protein
MYSYSQNTECRVVGRQSFKIARPPNDAQRHRQQQLAGACRYNCNKALALRMANPAVGWPCIRYVDIAKRLTQWRNCPETRWLADAHKLNIPNRLVRTRMPDGLTWVRLIAAPTPIKTSHFVAAIDHVSTLTATGCCGRQDLVRCQLVLNRARELYKWV